MNWLPFISPKKNWLQTFYTRPNSQFNWMVHFINKLRDEEVFACMCTRVRKRRENEVTRTPNSQSESRMNEPVFLRYGNNATNFNKSNNIERFLREWRTIKTLRRWEESNRIINTLLGGWPANMAGYFYSSSCILLPTRKNTQPYWLVNRLIRHMNYTVLKLGFSLNPFLRTVRFVLVCETADNNFVFAIV